LINNVHFILKLIIIILDIQHVIQIEIVGYKNLNNFINMQGVNNNCKNSNIKIINMMCIKLFKNCIKDKKRSKIIIKKIKRKCCKIRIIQAIIIIKISHRRKDILIKIIKFKRKILIKLCLLEM
jgi:hypothetical protein